MRTYEPRITPLAAGDLTPEQAELLAPLQVRNLDYNIFRTLARHPAALRAFLAWGSHVLSRANSLPPREREIAVLRTGYLCRSGYEWAQHVLIGQRSGLSEGEIAAIKTGAGAACWGPADRAILAACDELHDDQFISDSVWHMLCAHLTEQQRIDLVFTVGQYTQVSMLLNSIGVPLDDGLMLDPDLDGRP